MSDNKSKILGNLVIKLLNLRTQLYIYHWQTSIYSRHKSTDMLIDSLGKNIDILVETIQGKLGFRLKMSDNCVISLSNINDKGIISYLTKHISWLKGGFMNSLYKISYSRDDISDILNIRDDIINELNKTMYLFTLK